MLPAYARQHAAKCKAQGKWEAAGVQPAPPAGSKSQQPKPKAKQSAQKQKQKAEARKPKAVEEAKGRNSRRAANTASWV